MSSEKRKIAYIDGKPYEIGANHTSILKFVKSYVGEKKVPTLCDDPNLLHMGLAEFVLLKLLLKKMVQQELLHLVIHQLLKTNISSHQMKSLTRS
jgi:hypothetical protein